MIYSFPSPNNLYCLKIKYTYMISIRDVESCDIVDNDMGLLTNDEINFETQRDYAR